MNRFKAGLLAFVAALALSTPSWAAFPWSTSDPLEVSGATPTCTYTSTAFFCIENMTANVTSVTLAGMTAGKYYAIAFVQDGTGSRTLTQTSITGGVTIPATANQWTVWVIKATSASAATFVQNSDNAPLWDTWVTAQATGDGSPVANTASETPATMVVPGMTAAHRCSAVVSNPDANIRKGIVTTCVPGTNLVSVVETNPTAATITPTAATENIGIAP